MFAAAAPLHAAITPQLAKTCRAMMIKAHPTEVFGPDGSAAAQRHYFAECVVRNAEMPKANAKTVAAAPPEHVYRQWQLANVRGRGLAMSPGPAGVAHAGQTPSFARRQCARGFGTPSRRAVAAISVPGAVFPAGTQTPRAR